jgi:hypothetical protein
MPTLQKFPLQANGVALMRPEHKEYQNFSKWIVGPGKLAVDLRPEGLEYLSRVTMLQCNISNRHPYRP